MFPLIAAPLITEIIALISAHPVIAGATAIVVATAAVSQPPETMAGKVAKETLQAMKEVWDEFEAGEMSVEIEIVECDVAGFRAWTEQNEWHMEIGPRRNIEVTINVVMKRNLHEVDIFEV